VQAGSRWHLRGLSTASSMRRLGDALVAWATENHLPAFAVIASRIRAGERRLLSTGTISAYETSINRDRHIAALGGLEDLSDHVDLGDLD